MNWVDGVALVVLAIAVLFGWRSGFVIQAMALFGFVAGIVLIFVLAPEVMTLAADIDPWLRTVLVLAIIAGTVLLAQGIGSAAGAVLRRKLGPGVLGGIDNGLGAAFGMARGVFTVWLIGGLIAILPLTPVTTDARQSVILRTLDSGLPSPVVMAAELGRFMEEAGLPTPSSARHHQSTLRSTAHPRTRPSRSSRRRAAARSAWSRLPAASS